jgi:Domain of unknown function (DUF4129)
VSVMLTLALALQSLLRRMRSDLTRLWFVALLLSTMAVAQSQPDNAEESTAVRSVSAVAYRNHLEELRVLVQACQRDPAACDTVKVGDDERIEEAGFQMRWSWLRQTLSSAHSATVPGREEMLRDAAARLDEDVSLASGAVASSGGEYRDVRRRADEVLSRSEFRTVTQQSYLEREIAAFWHWLDEVFGGVSRFGRRAPWLVPAMEWSSVILAAAGVLTWVLRTMQRQKLAVRIETGATVDVWQKESHDWAELARFEAAREEWRAAVHCLYWATIVMIEGRKLWRQSRARTPREYLLLLEPGSQMQQALGRLTQIVERIWYGLRPAQESDYTRALTLFEELKGA